MIQHNNVQNRLPDNFIIYKTISTLIGSIIIFGILFLLFGHGPINGTVNGKPSVIDLEGINKILVIYGIPIFLFLSGLIYNVFYYKTFSYTLSDEAISITSGIIFVSTKSIDFHDIQNISSSFGPVLNLFGLGILSGFTSSPGQIIVSGNSKSTTTSYRPDIHIILNKEDVEELRMFMSKADDIGKVKVVS